MTLSKWLNLSEPLLVLIPGRVRSPWLALLGIHLPFHLWVCSPSGEKRVLVGVPELAQGPGGTASLLQCVLIPTKQAVAPYNAGPVRPRAFFGDPKASGEKEDLGLGAFRVDLGYGLLSQQWKPALAGRGGCPRSQSRLFRRPTGKTKYLVWQRQEQRQRCRPPSTQES